MLSITVTKSRSWRDEAHNNWIPQYALYTKTFRKKFNNYGEVKAFLSAKHKSSTWDFFVYDNVIIYTRTIRRDLIRDYGRKLSTDAETFSYQYEINEVLN